MDELYWIEVVSHLVISAEYSDINLLEILNKIIINGCDQLIVLEVFKYVKNNNRSDAILLIQDVIEELKMDELKENLLAVLKNRLKTEEIIVNWIKEYSL